MALMVGGRAVIPGVAGSDVVLVEEDVANLSLLMLKILLIGGCIFLLFIEFATFFHSTTRTIMFCSSRQRVEAQSVMENEKHIVCHGLAALLL